MRKTLALILLLGSACAHAQNDTTRLSGGLFDMSLEDLLQLDLVDRNFYLYGYINSNFQKTFDYPVVTDDGSFQKISDPGEWSPVRDFHLYGSGNFNRKISYL